jgi:hypothetical protein
MSCLSIRPLVVVTLLMTISNCCLTQQSEEEEEEDRLEAKALREGPAATHAITGGRKATVGASMKFHRLQLLAHHVCACCHYYFSSPSSPCLFQLL